MEKKEIQEIQDMIDASIGKTMTAAMAKLEKSFDKINNRLDGFEKVKVEPPAAPVQTTPPAAPVQTTPPAAPVQTDGDRIVKAIQDGFANNEKTLRDAIAKVQGEDPDMEEIAKEFRSLNYEGRKQNERAACNVRWEDAPLLDHAGWYALHVLLPVLGGAAAAAAVLWATGYLNLGEQVVTTDTDADVLGGATAFGG